MYKCKSCNKVFDEPEKIQTTYESYRGVSGEFQNSTPFEYEVCPFCEEGDFKAMSENEIEIYYLEIEIKKHEKEIEKLKKQIEELE